ncbi:MAG: retron system putative HNH endonuclease [Phycisphaeraceae bacterium]
MRPIHKKPEPQSLTEHRCSPHADYDNYSGEDELRDALIAEQRGLCCYCMSRIHKDAMKIAHWHSQTGHPAEQLDYANLLGACMGNKGRPKKEQHCDTHQENENISINPANRDHHQRIEQFIRYPPDGRIESDDIQINHDLNDILNLNMADLKNQRKSVLEGFQQALSRTQPNHWTRPMLERHLRLWSGESDGGDLKPFCQVVIYWLRKRLMRM